MAHRLAAANKRTVIVSPSYAAAEDFREFSPENRRKSNPDGVASPFLRCSQDFTY
jgi:hypothetical protein